MIPRVSSEYSRLPGISEYNLFGKKVFVDMISLSHTGLRWALNLMTVSL